MLLDGGLVGRVAVEARVQRTLDAVDAQAATLGALAVPTTRAAWVERLHVIGASLEPRRYADARFVAERLHRMTAGRTRIELAEEHVDVVAATLVTVQPAIVEAAGDVVESVREAVPIPRHRV